MQMITQFRTGTRKSTKDGLTLIDWIGSNQKQAHPDKVQAIAVGLKSFEQVNQVKHFSLVGVDIPCEENVKLFGV